MKKIVLHSSDFSGMDSDEIQSYIQGLLDAYPEERRLEAVDQIREEADKLSDQDVASAIRLALVNLGDVFGGDAVELCTQAAESGNSEASSIRESVFKKYHRNTLVISITMFVFSVGLCFLNARFGTYSLYCSVPALIVSLINIPNNEFSKGSMFANQFSRFCSYVCIPVVVIGLMVSLGIYCWNSIVEWWHNL